VITSTCELARSLLGVLYEQFTRLLGESIMRIIKLLTDDNREAIDYVLFITPIALTVYGFLYWEVFTHYIIKLF